MKSFLNCLVLAGLVVLVGCSGDSPSPPPVPTVVPDVWSISALAPSDSNPYVNTSVTITATVTKNGEPAPDGTIVEFVASGGIFLSSSGVEASVATVDGEATALFGATSAGPYSIQARVRTATRQTQVVYREFNTSDALQIWSINPTSGSYVGGETVVLTGKGIQAPVEVYMTVQGTQYQAIVDAVAPSVPLSAAGTITIRTPEPTAANTSTSSAANVRVVVGVGTTEQQEQTLPSAFTFIGITTPPPGVPPTPVIYGVEPYWGRSRGGEIVTILGTNFSWDATKEIEPTFSQVYFRFRGQDLLAQVERYSANQIEVVTPRFSLTPLNADENAGVVIVPTDGSGNVVKNDVFIVLADIAQPAITGISPTAGPLDGGTVVTITGHGFEVPLQVLFGTLEATDIQVHDDQTVNDNDEITCRTPDYSQQVVTPPFTTTVRVTNLSTGNSATAAQSFTFGDSLYVSQASPSEGQIGDLLVLYGAGFEDPLQVWYIGAGADVEFDVIAVTGTEITLRSPPELPPTCDDRTGRFRVILTQSNQQAEGGSYTLLGSNPTITAVDPIFVYEFNAGNGVDPSEIDIYGVRFNDELLVEIAAYTMAPNQVTVLSSEQIHVEGIPAPLAFNLVFDTIPCTTGGGLPGIKNAPTPVDVTVRNLPLGCQDTLQNTLVYVPEDQTCVAAPDLVVGPLSFDVTPAGTCSPPVNLFLQNQGAGDLDIQSLTLQGRFFFQPGFNQNAGPLTVPAYTSNSTLDVYFCPDVDTNALYTGALVILSNDPNSPAVIGLSGQEAPPPEILLDRDPTVDWNFGDQSQGGCGAPQALTISASAAGGPLTVSNVVSSDDVQFHYMNPPSWPYVLQPGTNLTVNVEFCPGSVATGITAMLSIDHDASNQPNPITITMIGNGTTP